MRKYISFLLLLALSSCIKPFDIEVDEGAKLLVVNGLITNEPGPYSVKINKTTSYGGHFTDVHWDVRGAEVTISDDLGKTVTLTEVLDGEFQTDSASLRGEIGRTYTLRVRLKNGEEYVSEPEMLRAAPPIDRLYYQYKETTIIDENREEQPYRYFELFLDTKDPAAEKNFYRWVSKGTYEVETQPENFVVYDKRGNPVPSPKDCCRQCWVTKVDYSATVTNDRQFNGNSLIAQPVTTIQITSQFLGIKYHVALKQYALSESGYQFWKMMESQSSGTGSVQDPAPANPQGNIYSLTKPEEQVLGYFGASGVSTKTLYLKRSDVPFVLPPFIFPNDCQVIPGATTKKPSFWE